MNNQEINAAVTRDIAQQIGNMAMDIAQYRATAQAMNAEINRLRTELETLKASKPEQKE